MNTQSDMTNGQIVIKGGIGAGASLGAFTISHVQQINAVLQTCALALGIAISIVTLIKLVRKKQKDKNEN